MKKINYLTILLLAASLFIGCSKQKPSVISVDVSKEGIEVSKTLWGIFYEEISRAGDGGLYPEMIYNRGFEEKNFPSTMTFKDGALYAPSLPSYNNPTAPPRNWSIRYNADNKEEGWTLDVKGSSKADMQVVTDKPQLNAASPHSLLLNITSYDGNVALLNEGFWGISVVSGEKYDLLFHVRTPGTYTGKIVASIIGSTGNVIAKNEVDVVKDGTWKPYAFTFTSDVTDNKAKLSLQFSSTGKLWLDYISLLPESTFMNHGLRKDISQVLADLKPAFIRWPGGCIVEGCTMEDRVKWWESIGPVIGRTGTFDLWGYFNSYGFGYHDFLQLCEDLGAKGMFVSNAGVSCSGRNGDFYDDKKMAEIIEQDLGAIEYALGDVTTKWGAERAKNGHPAPFPLTMVEIGNENSGPVYGAHYNMIYKALKAKYPQLTYINTNSLPRGNVLPSYYDADKIEMFDPHYYRNPDWFFANVNIYDTVPRGKFDLYVGEYAVNSGVGTGNMSAALSEAAYMIGMEKNSDIVKMTSYAPLFENVNDKDWQTNLIRFKNDSVFGRSSYYAQQMFAYNRPDVMLGSTLTWVPPAEKIIGGVGLSSNSAVALKNITLSKGSSTVYKSSFPADTAKWRRVSGTWEVKDDAYAAKASPVNQSGQGQRGGQRGGQPAAAQVKGGLPAPTQPQFIQIIHGQPQVGGGGGGGRGGAGGGRSNAINLKDLTFENFTLSTDLMRDSIFSGLNIKFGIVDDNNYFQLAISGFQAGGMGARGGGGGGGGFQQGQQAQPRTYTATLQQVVNGSQGGQGGGGGGQGGGPQPGRIDKQFELSIGQWHNVKMTVNGKMVSLEVDGTPIGQVEYKRPQKQYAIAGYDKTNGEVIIKVVNGEGFPFNTKIDLANATEINPVVQVIELSAASNYEENDFKAPKKISPVMSEYAKFGKSFDMTFKPYSLTMLRIKAK